MLLTDCQMCPNGLRMRGKYVYAGTMNRLPTAADGLPKCPQRIAKTHTTQTQKHYHCAPPYCYLFYKTHIQPHTNTHYI